MKWWVLTDFLCTTTPTSFFPLATTDQLDHLFLTWSYIKPTRSPIWRTIRGTRKLCGYLYKWDSPNIEEQAEPGDTLTHSFPIEGLPSHTTPTTIWYYLHSPLFNEGNQCQSPLMSAILPTVICSPLWTFDINIVGWTIETGSVRWFNDGSPNPGCMELYGTGNSAVYSDFFPSLGASSVIIELERKHIETTQRLLCVDSWGPTGWHELTCWYDRDIPWTHGHVRDAAGWVLPNTRLRIRKVSSGTWRVDTICVRLYP